MIDVRIARAEDEAFWFSLDRHLPRERYQKKVREGEAYVLLEDGVPRGILRYSLFWENTPFCDLLYIEEASRRKGFGRALMSYWEEEMDRRGCGIVLTSTQADEEAQHFYRKLGYRDCGGFVLPTPGQGEPMELILAKVLGQGEER